VKCLVLETKVAENMHKKAKKRFDNKIKIAAILAIAIIIALVIFAPKKPSPTGYAVLTEEKTVDDDLNLVINESSTYSWNLKNPGELKSIKATGSISKNGSAKVYIKKGDEKVLIFDSAKPLFDVNIKVLPDYKKILQGDELLIQTTLFNLKGFGSVDVNVKYSIKDSLGTSIASEEEIITVETQASFIRKLLIPSDLKAGTYLAFVEVTTPGGLIGTSSDLFEVSAKYEEKAITRKEYYGIGIAIILILIIGAILIFRKLKRNKRANELKKKMPEEKIKKLRNELEAIKKAYQSKFISERSYKKNTERIEKELKGLEKKQAKRGQQEKIKKRPKEMDKEIEPKQEAAEKIHQEKLGKKLRALENVYKSGFISENSYKKDKEKIENELKKLEP